MPIGYVLLDFLAFFGSAVTVAIWGRKGALTSILASVPIGLFAALIRHLALEKFPLSEALARGVGQGVTWLLMAIPGIIVGLIVRALWRRAASPASKSPPLAGE